ncbi:ABC transporter ATP-binding protein [Actinacidiphila sp. ITFR-21]|uniref:ABC transporter ATP-binding protein n=1 Tax=Actinacidiphila sp. ITFR-21 TaxID=3075199 RepID=UPI00288B691D|nr:ATP-binding cassette domain-containing protein [Streptomyces sp. ITFR-21]WNI18749.1 ATP-binding cassette domain-containing protein [Streptomyces sp. ITFR-21]
MLRTENLSVSFGKVAALKNVTVQIESATVQGVIGPNGAGKSTLMDALSGRVKATTGHVYLDDADITTRSVTWRRRQGISRSFQRTSIFPTQTVREQLELVAGRSKATDATEIADALGLGEVLDRVAGEIAYGDQRRVDIALALVGNPTLLLLDEPGAGLSAAETLSLFEHVAALVKDRGVTAAIVEHDVDAVFATCDTVTVLDLGTVLASGKPEDVRRDDRVITAYLGSAA